MALPAYQYRDPMIVLEQKQQRELKKTCIGCAHAFEIKFKSGPAKGCDLGKLYGKKCNSFQEVK